MTSHAAAVKGPSIKGWCPGALKPMRSGDGLVVRLRLETPVLSSELGLAIADLALTHGNGQIDLSQRANLQLRGISEGTWPDVITRLSALRLIDADADIEAVRNILVSPLGRLDPAAQIDGYATAATLRAAIAEDPAFRQLPGKFSFVIDDGGALPLDGVDGDIRFFGDNGRVAVEIGDFWRIGIISPADVGVVAARLAAAFLALRGDEPDRIRRMRGLIATRGGQVIAEAAGLDPNAMVKRPVRADASVIGQCRPHILGVGIPFGRLTASQLGRLADIASRYGNGEIRLTPWRAVLLPGIDTIPAELAATDSITSHDDARLAVVACPGAPDCESAVRPIRADALALAGLAAKLPGSGIRLHVSACPKGCARPASTQVTLIARENGYDLVRNGRASDHPTSTELTRQAIEGVLMHLATDKPLNDRATYIRDGAAIYEKSFAIIRAEADLARFTSAEEPVAVRIIHASGMVDVASDIVFSPGSAAAARTALRAGAPIFADAEMVARGVTRARLPANNDVICTLTDPRVAGLAEAAGTTRSAAAMELWRDRLAGSIVAIGNAPTSLYRLLELLDEGAGLPACVIGMPVGFVGAAESKAALIADGRVPFIVVTGRKGGSAMAAAAVNALASERE